MTKINYRLMSFADDWVLWVEGVPVQRFCSKSEGLHAATIKVEAADRRGDKATLLVQPRAGAPVERHVQ